MQHDPDSMRSSHTHPIKGIFVKHLNFLYFSDEVEISQNTKSGLLTSPT